jgi:patatin-like phospholipase
MPKRLAITISGAVSLGSYEAGVLFEIIEALRQHNINRETTDSEKILIDVITGASAGGMTAAIATQKLLYDASALAGERNNAFYLPWVFDVSLQRLLQLQRSDNAAHSILSSELVRTIAHRYLLARYDASVPPKRESHPAAAPTIRLGLALSNINGVDYDRPLQTRQQKFTYTRYQDEYTTCFELGNPEHDTAAAWRFACEAALSTGAFPFAFRLVPLTRSRQEYVNADPVGSQFLLPWPAATAMFAYTDGGTFQNEPLGLAKNLVDITDQHRDADSRFYLFVSPGLKRGDADARFQASSPDIPVVIGHLVGAIFNQARFQDWVTAESMNDRIRLFDERALGLKDLILDGTIDPERDLQAASKALLPILFTKKEAGHTETYQSAQQRLSHQYKKEFDDIVRQKPGRTEPDSNAKLWIDAMLTLETAAQLGMRDEMVIYGITAEENKLASNPICAFGGFFDLRFREHDYAVGRQKAREFLRELNNPAHDVRRPKGLSTLGPIRCQIPENDDDLNVDHSLDGLKFENLDKDLLSRFENQGLKRIDDLLEQLSVNSVIRWLVCKFYLKPKLQEFLGGSPAQSHGQSRTG